MKTFIILVLTSLVLTSCWPDRFDDKNGKFLDEVVRLDEFNSEFDDYNSNLPSNKSGHTYLIFSSNREKKDFFNLVYFPAEFTYDNKLGLKKFTNSSGVSYDYYTTYSLSTALASRANGNFNVLGPKIMSFSDDFVSYGAVNKDLVLFYADDSEGNLEIKYVLKSNDGIQEPAKFDLLNSSKDDAYPTLSNSGEKIYFCSNREGSFDIYEVIIPQKGGQNITMESLVNPKEFTLRKVEELSSPYDDKCPYLSNNTMVFVSNRPGGKGGYDIYSSKLENGKWSAPVNVGDRINTVSDEYRPVLPLLQNFNYNLMLFSSNRLGGKGGFDLYMTGLDKFD